MDLVARGALGHAWRNKITRAPWGYRVIPGEIFAAAGSIELNVGRERVEVLVENTGDRPVQVGSHYEFAQANPALSFDRGSATGFRLDIPAGTSVRFEPGMSLTVGLVRLAGRRVVPGLRSHG